MSETAELILFFVLGAMFGSFANVVIYRLPQGKSVVFPGSTCSQCGAKVQWYDNIPIFSWFLLRGKCRSCSQKFSFRYPLVEFLTGTFFALTYWQLGLSWFLLEVLILVLGLVIISFIDLDHMIIPNVISLPGIVVGLVGGALNPERPFNSALFGLLLGGVFFFSIAYLYALIRKREGLGGGDIKLLAWIGSVLGWPSIPFVVMVSSVVGIVFGLIISIRSKRGMQTEIPFGPYIAFAALVYIWIGPSRITDWIFNLYGIQPLTP